MHELTSGYIHSLLADHKEPCISLYMPTHRTYPENQQDPILYRNLLKQLEHQLANYPEEDVRPLMRRFRALEEDREFWTYRSDALAILGSPDMFEIFDLQRAETELVIVSDSFHIKPLLRELQTADRYHVLCLHRDGVKLFEGNRDSLSEVELKDVPQTMEDALGTELTEPELRHSSYGKGGRGPGQGNQGMYNGQHGGSDEVMNDTIRYFRAVDRAILEHYSKPTGLPLMLAALKEHHAAFRGVSHNPFLIDEGLMLDPTAFSLKELRVKAWQRMEPVYLGRLQKLIERCRSARAARQGSDSLDEVVPAALDGRVESLLIEADRQIPGRIDTASREIFYGGHEGEGTDDVLDDLAEIVLRTNGEVVIVPPGRMPSPSGLAAIYRF